MRRGFHSFLSVVLTLSMLMSLCVPAWADTYYNAISGSGSAAAPFVISSKYVRTLRVGSGSYRYLLGKTDNTNYSKSEIEPVGTPQKDGSTDNYNTEIKTLKVGDGEYVTLTGIGDTAGQYNFETQILGAGTLTYNNSSTASDVGVVTGVASSDETAYNTLRVLEGRVARVQGFFGTVEGTVQTAGNVTLSGNNYTVKGIATKSGSTYTGYDVTISGEAKLSGYFKKVTLQTGATAEITGNTYIGTVVQNAGSKLTVDANVMLNVAGSAMQPADGAGVTFAVDASGTNSPWKTTPVLPAGHYAVASGAWVLGGDVTVDDTVFEMTYSDDRLVVAYALNNVSPRVSNSDALSARLNGKTLTINNGTVKASGASGDGIAEGGTVVGVGDLPTLQVIGDNVTAKGAFRAISMTGGNTMTVPEGETISAFYETTRYSVRVRQNTVFTSFEGVLPTSGNSSAPYQFDNVIGNWKQSEETTSAGEDFNNAALVIGDDSNLTVTQDNVTIRGTFKTLKTGDHVVKLVGDTVIGGGSFKVRGANAADVPAAEPTTTIDALPSYNLTINGGSGEVSGRLKSLTVNDGTVADGTDLSFNNTGNNVHITAITLTGGTLKLTHEPDIRVSGGMNTPAIKVTGGTLTLQNGAVEGWGDSVHVIEVSGGAAVIGDPTLDTSDVNRCTPQLTSHDKGSVCLYVGTTGRATVYDGTFVFNGEDSYGVRVDNGGTAKLYPNDLYGENNPTMTAPLIQISGGTGAKAAMWVNEGATFEIRGRGALLEQPFRESGESFALLISDMASGALAGGTFNGKVYYRFNGSERRAVAGLFPANHYLRYDGNTANYGASNGSCGVLPVQSPSDAQRYGDYVKSHASGDAISETYQDSFGVRGKYYTVMDAEWELRYHMAVGGRYQIPAGMVDGSGNAVDTLTLDQNDPTLWAIGKKQGDLNVVKASTLYLAGRTLTYDGADLSGVAEGNKKLLTDTNQDNLHTVALTGGNLTVIDAVFNGEGTDRSADKFAGGYIGTGTIEYTGSAEKETAAVHVCGGTLHMISGKLVNANTYGSSSGAYVHGDTESFGTASFGSTGENNDNKIILIDGKKQALKVAGGVADVYGGTLSASGSVQIYGAAVTGGTLNVKGGYVKGDNVHYGVYATGGTTDITGGCIYGDTSLYVDGDTAVMNLKVDENHKVSATVETDETSGKQYVKNIYVASGELNIGELNDASYSRNNGNLTCAGGKTTVFEGVTIGETQVYGAQASGEGKGFGTQFYVKSGDFANLAVLNYNKETPVGSYQLNGTGGLRDYVQLHGGCFNSIQVDVKVDEGTAGVQDVIGVWAQKNHDGTASSWARYNHYAETVDSTRVTNNASEDWGKWSAKTDIQSGSAWVSNSDQISADNGKAISIRSAVDEFAAWAAGKAPGTFKLYANLWLDNDNPLCENDVLCTATMAPVTVSAAARTLDLNGFGIYGDTEATALLTMGSGGNLTVMTGEPDAAEGYANRIRNFKGTAVSVPDGTLTVNSGSIVGSTYGVEQSGGRLTITGGTFAGKDYGLYRTAAGNQHFITGGKFSGIQTTVEGEKLSDLLAENLTFRDGSVNQIEAGADVLAKSSLKNGDPSGDAETTGGDSVKYDGNGLTYVGTGTTLKSSFTVTDRAIREVTLTANDKATISLALTQAVLDSGDNVKNATRTLYIAKDGGSATATITPDRNYCTGVVTRNGSENANLSHKSTAQTVPLTESVTSLTANAVACHIHKSIESGITKNTESGNRIILTGSNLAKPTVQKESEGRWVDASADVTISGNSSSYTVDFPDLLTTDYKLTATVIRSGGGGGAAPAPATTVSVSGDENSVSVSASVSGGTATMSEPTEKELEKVIGAGVETGAVVINMSGLNDSVTAAAIPTNTVKAVEKAVSDTTNDASGLTIKLPNATATFDAAAVSAISSQMKGTELALTVEKIAFSKLVSGQQNLLKEIDAQEVISITLKSGISTISDFKGGHATVSVPYTLKAGQNSRGIVVWYVPNSGELAEIPASYSNGQLTFTLTHFSEYVIAYDETRANACPQDSTCPITAFADADATAWYHDGVHWALENGVMSGYGNLLGKGQLFAPNSDTTRAMVAQILWNLEGKPAYVGMSEYDDVDNEAWYGAAIRWASAEGIVTGYENPTGTGMLFDPDGAVTREQLAAMLYRYAKYKGVDVSVGEDTNILSYSDAFSVSEWAIPAMQWAVGSGIINGIDSDLVPVGNATRAQVATMLMRYSTAK